MRYYVVEKDEYYDDYYDVIDACVSNEYYECDDEDFEEWVNDCYGSISIGGERYYAYDIISNAEDGNYGDLKESYCESRADADRDEARYELRNAENGERVYIQGYTIEVANDDEEEYSDSSEPDQPVSNDQLIYACRQKVEEEHVRIQQLQADEKAEESDYLKMFQVIGA